MVDGASFRGAGDADLGAATAELRAQPQALGGIVGHHLQAAQVDLVGFVHFVSPIS